MRRYLGPVAARRFYDRVGKLEDTQAFYEAPALDALVRHGAFDTAGSVFEFGCGTGRFARQLLTGPLPDDARYCGCDISGKMVDIAQKRLSGFAGRATVWQSDGGIDFAPGNPPFDRIVTTYVLDLMSPQAIGAFIDAAHDRLSPGGRLCAASITPADRGIARLISAGWSGLHHLAPILVGGCRPIRLDPWFDRGQWRILYRARFAPWAITSQVIVATPL